MTLLETKTAQWYQVEEIHEWENVQRRLEALGKEIAGGIEVKEYHEQ